MQKSVYPESSWISAWTGLIAEIRKGRFYLYVSKGDVLYQDPAWPDIRLAGSMSQRIPSNINVTVCKYRYRYVLAIFAYRYRKKILLYVTMYYVPVPYPCFV